MEYFCYLYVVKRPTLNLKDSPELQVFFIKINKDFVHIYCDSNHHFYSAGREPPEVKIYPESRQVVHVGSSAMFQCHLIGGTPTPTVIWSRADGSAMTPNTATLDGGVLR